METFNFTDEDLREFLTGEAGITPIFSSEKKYREYVNSLGDKLIEDTYTDSYIAHFQNIRILVEKAKLFIYDNWKKVDDWSELEITLFDTDNKVEFYVYNNEEEYNECIYHGQLNEYFKEIEEENRKRHNPVKTVDDVVLDFMDGDLSITINGIDFLFINIYAIMTISSYIEYKLKEQE